MNTNVNLTIISENEFEKAESIFKIINHENSNFFRSFECQNKKYFISNFSPDILPDFLYLEKENYLLIGIDLKVVILNTRTGSILFSIGLYSFFKGFENSSDLTITIFSETADIIVNKNYLSINQIIAHELYF